MAAVVAGPVMLAATEYQPIQATASSASGGCQSTVTTGSLSATTVSNWYTFASSGGGQVVFQIGDAINIRHRDYPNFEIQLWGGETYHTFEHENLNGKHIKDWLGNRRTIIFPDGAKVTITVAGTGSDRRAISMMIYEGTQVHRLDPSTGQLEYSRELSTEAVRELDDAEADGETSTFEITGSGLVYYTLYTENVPGQKVESRYDLGSLVLGNDNQINDYFDDPRIGHT